jgi:hypothetical protein
MDHAENPQAEVIEKKIAFWTFRRSLEPLATQLEGKVLRALWEHEGYFFGIWEPEVMEDFSESERRLCRPLNLPFNNPDCSFFRWDAGAPHVHIVGAPREGSWEQRTTSLRDTLDILSIKKLTTFHIPRVIYHTERCGWDCTIISQVPGRSLEIAILDVVGRDRRGGWFNDATSPAQLAEVTGICTRAADQVVDAVVEMSKFTSNKVWGIGRKASPDVHFTNAGTIMQLLSPEEVAQNCKDAGMDPYNTVLGPGNLMPFNIILDKDGNFVGFESLEWAGYAPREWVQLGTIDPTSREKEEVRIHVKCDLPSKPGPERDLNSVPYLWLNILSEKLASKGFPKLEANRLRWLMWRKTGNVTWGPVPRQSESAPESESPEAPQS